MTFTYTWDETTPDNNDYAYEIDDFMRETKAMVRERMTVEHIWGNSDGSGGDADGQHQRGRCRVVYVGDHSNFPSALRGAIALASDENNKLYVATADGTWTAAAVEYAFSAPDMSGESLANHIAKSAIEAHALGLGAHRHRAAMYDSGTVNEGRQLTTSAFYFLDTANNGVWDAISKGETKVIPHGLAAQPRMAFLYISNGQTVADQTWVTQDQGYDGDANSQCAIVMMDDTNITIKAGDTYLCNIQDKDGNRVKPTTGFYRVVAIF